MAFLLAYGLLSPAKGAFALRNGPRTAVTVQLRWTHQFQFAGFYAAIARGYYAEAGLDVRLIERVNGVDVLEEVLSGRADFGLGDSGLILHYFDGKPIVALGAIFQHSPDIILSRTVSGITNPRELRGRKLMIRDTASGPQWAMLSSQGIKKEDLDIVDLTWSTKELIEGSVDAMSAYITDQPYDLKQADIPVNIMRPQTYGIDFYGDTLFTTNRIAQDKPELVEAFLQATYKGWEYAMSNPEEIISIIRFQYNPNRTLGQLRHEADAMHELVVPRLVELGSMNTKRWENIATTYRSLGMTEKSLPLNDFIYVPKAQRELISMAKWIPYFTVVVMIGALASLLLFFLNRRLKNNLMRQHEEMEHSRKNLRQVVDLVPSLIYIKDDTGRFILVNRTMAESLGTGVDDLIGARHMDLHPDQDEAIRMQETDLAVIKTGLPKVSVEESYRHADGTTHWLQSTRLPFTMADSDEQAVLALSIDITNRRAAEAALKASEERFRAIFNQTYQFSGMLSHEGDLIQINETALTVFEQNETDLLNKPFHKISWWSQEDKEQKRIKEAIRRAALGETVQDYVQNILPDGSTLDVDFTLKPARNDEGKIIFLIAEGRDITPLKESEEELRRLNEELEERVAERTRNLEKAKKELEISLEKLRQTQEELILSEKLAALGGLVAGVAHEINTPLGVGVTASSFLAEKLRKVERKLNNNDLKKSDLEKFFQTGRESCASILTNLERAAELIKSFKQVAADQSSELPRGFNLKSYVDEVLASLKPKYKRTDHVIENHAPDVELYSFPGAFMQIITNLLVNSLTHGYADGEYGRIRIGGRVRGKTLTFTFDDDGCGIPESERDKVFEPFYTTKRAQGGTGLGLHIVYNTVTQNLNGTIKMESEVDGGTHFSITMPLTQKEN